MEIRILLITILQFIASIHTIDLLQEGRRVILQKDIEHVLVRLDLNSIRRAISNSRKSVLDARGLVLVNTLQGKTDRDVRQILKLLEHTLQEVGIREATFFKLFEHSNNERRQMDKRLSLIHI